MRNYRKEYENYHSKPKQKKNRAKRNAARAEMERKAELERAMARMWPTRSR